MYVRRTCLIGIVALTLNAQYFGQNKVRYRTFDFQVLKTQHFDIHYYEKERAAAVEVGRMAERWYVRLSKSLGHQLSPNQPVILYANHPDFRGTTVIPGYIGETTGGVTEGLRRRLVMPLAGPLAETDHVLGHELVHAFQFDITSRLGPEGGAGLPGALRLPLWFIEGMAEYLSLGPVDAHTAMWMRDAVRREAIPPIKDLNDPKYFPYRYGQAFWAFVGGRYGDEVIGQLLKSAGRAGSVEGAIQRVLKISPQELSKQWRQALIDEYEPVLQATAPASEQAKLLISKDQGGGEINVSPVLSPDGKQFVFFSERDIFSINMYLADAESGEVRDKITETAVDPHIDSLQFVNSAGAWSKDGKRFAYGAIREGRPALAIYDVAAGETVRHLSFPDLGEVFTPTWSPDDRHIAFSANSGGVTDLFVVEVETNNLRRITNDSFADLQPSWSPDGTRIAFVTDRFSANMADLAFGHYRLALLNPQSGKIDAVPAFQTGKHTNPQWSPDGSDVYFISDRDGVSNIYRVAMKGGAIRQMTNLQTGVSGISSLSPAFSVAANSGSVIFSAFLGDDYNIFLLSANAGAPPSNRLASLTPAVLPPREKGTGQVASFLRSPAIGLRPARGFTTTDYQPKLSLDYIAPPSVSAGVSNFGSMIAGGTALYFSDLLGYHNLMTAFQTSTMGDAGNILNNLSAIAGYQNQKHRWTWGFIGGQVPFLSGSVAGGPATIDGVPVLLERSALFWQINREVSGILAYPFNRAQRVEFSGGYQNVSFDAETRTRVFSGVTGELLGEDSEDIGAPASLNMGRASAALVYDTSLFGGTSPVAGQRYRFEIGQQAGTLTFSTVLADYRRYLRLGRNISLAGRFMHVGRYGGGGAEDRRLQDIFLGYPSLVRGYTPGSFSAEECGPSIEENGSCPVFDQLIGSRMAIANAELRIPLLGTLGLIPSRGFPPVEIAPFYDAGVAWRGSEKASFLGGPRDPVTSYGASLRFNILGFAIGQLSYVRPTDRPLKNWIWEFSLIPGF